MPGTFPIAAPASGAYPLSVGFTTSQLAADVNNTNDVDNYNWGGVDTAPTVARVATTGGETYTIASGSVTVINGTTIDGVSVAVNDVVLVKDAPASSGAGAAEIPPASTGTSQPGNGLYVVTAVATNISVARAGTQSSLAATQQGGTGANQLPQGGPAGRVVFVRAGALNGITMWSVTTPSAVAAFTYGTTAMQWKIYSLSANNNVPNTAIQQAGINNANVANQSQVVVSGTAYYITNSGLLMPASALTGMTANKTRFVWRIGISKTAAGTGAFQLAIYRGTLGTTGDTQDVLQTLGTQTAVVDDMFVDVTLTVTTIGATGAYYWTMAPSNVASAIGTPAGFGVTRGTTSALFSGTKSSVALNTASLIFGLGFVATTGTPTITVPMVQAYAYNMN